MITSYNKAILKDANGLYDITVEVGWRPEIKNKIRFTLDEKTAIIDINDLYSLAIMAVTPQQQDDLLPIRSVEVMKYRKQHRVRATKFIKPGETLNVNCEINVPVLIYEGLKKDLKTII